MGRIGTFAVFDPLSEESRQGVAENAIRDLAGEFGLVVNRLPAVVVDVVRDLADTSEIGARSLTYAARDLLADAFAQASREGAAEPSSSIRGRRRTSSGAAARRPR